MIERRLLVDTPRIRYDKTVRFQLLCQLLWSPCEIRQTIIFSSCGFYLLSNYLLFLFPCLISAAARWISTILRHIVWPYSANLECRSETCCTALAANTGRKKSSKSRHLGTIAQVCRAISLQCFRPAS